MVGTLESRVEFVTFIAFVTAVAFEGFATGPGVLILGALVPSDPALSLLFLFVAGLSTTIFLCAVSAAGFSCEARVARWTGDSLSTSSFLRFLDFELAAGKDFRNRYVGSA